MTHLHGVTVQHKAQLKNLHRMMKIMHCLVLNEVGRGGGVKVHVTSVFQLCDL